MTPSAAVVLAAMPLDGAPLFTSEVIALCPVELKGADVRAALADLAASGEVVQGEGVRPTWRRAPAVARP